MSAMLSTLIASALLSIVSGYDTSVSPGGGSGTGDPHFVGFDGRPFDYRGEPGAVFSVISTDVNVHVNAVLVPEVLNGLTYMGGVGIATPVGNVAVKAVPEAQSLLISVDDVPLGNTWDMNVEHDLDGGVQVKRIDAQVVEVMVQNVVALTLAMRHNQFVDITRAVLLLTPTATNIHGVLGQTAIPGRTFVGYEGEDRDYFVSSMFRNNFKFGRWDTGSSRKSLRGARKVVPAAESALFGSASNFRI